MPELKYDKLHKCYDLRTQLEKKLKSADYRVRDRLQHRQDTVEEAKCKQKIEQGGTVLQS